MGVVACLAIGHLALWLGRRADRLSLWVGAWCVNTVVYVGSHYVQVTTEDGARAVLAGRWAWSSALVMIPLLIGVSHALVGERPSRRALLVTSLLSAVLVAGLWIGEGMITNSWYVRTDRLSGAYLAAAPGPLQPVVLPYILAAFAYCMRVMARARSLGVWERRLFLGGIAVYAALGVNDALHAAQIIESGRVFDFAFVGFAVGLTYFHARRYNRVQTHLEEEVTARTTELAGLVRAGQFVLGGLDLDATLTRIVEEAARIAGTPHVKLLLVDKDVGVLRLVAIAGATAPKDFTVPLGQSYSGTVAATGEPIFIGDTQNDPRNLLAQRDREQGIRTYLGLPVRFGSEVVGVLTLNTETPVPWTPAQLASLGSFADVAAVAIGNARLYTAATDQGQRLAALVDLTQSLTSTLALDQVLDRVVQHAGALFEPSVARLWLMDEGGQTLSLRAHAGAKAEAGGIVRMTVGEGLMGAIAAARAPLVVEDVQTDSRVRNLGRIRAGGHRLLRGGAPRPRRPRPRRPRPRPLEAASIHPGGSGLAPDTRRPRRRGHRERAALRGGAGAGARAHRARRGADRAHLHPRPPAVLESIGEWAVKLIGADGSAVFELDARAQVLNPRTSRDLAPTAGFVHVAPQGRTGGGGNGRQPPRAGVERRHRGRSAAGL